MDHDTTDPTATTPPDPAPTGADHDWVSPPWDTPSCDRDVLRGYLLDLLDRRSRELAARDAAAPRWRRLWGRMMGRG